MCHRGAPLDTPRLDHSTRLMPRDNGTLLCSDTCADVTLSPEQGHHYRPPHHPKPVHPHSTATTPNHCISTAQPPPPKHHILMAQPASQIILSLSAWTPRSHDTATSLSHNVPIDMDTTPLHGTATTTGHRVPMAWLLPQNRHSPKPPCSHGTASSPGYHIPMAWPPPQTTSSLSTRPRTQISASPGHSHHLIQPCPYQHGHHPKQPHPMAQPPPQSATFPRCRHQEHYPYYPTCAAPREWGQHPERSTKRPHGDPCPHSLLVGHHSPSAKQAKPISS